MIHKRACVLAVFAGLGAGLCSPGDAHASFTAIKMEYHATIQAANGPREVWRIYACYNQGDDELDAWGSNPKVNPPPLVVRTVLCATGAAGNAFFNPQGGGTIAPTLQTIKNFPLAEFDSFVTINVSIAEQGASPPGEYPDGTLLLPGFVGFEATNQLSSSQGYVWTAADALAQGRADYAADGDPAWRVLLMQTSVRPDNLILYTIPGLWYRPADGGPEVVITDLTNESAVLPGRCCMRNGACLLLMQEQCQTFGGTYLGCQPCADCTPTCPGDIAPVPPEPGGGPNGDGTIDINDLVSVITSWGPCTQPFTCHADIAPTRGDGHVNIDDLVAVITSWGTCGR